MRFLAHLFIVLVLFSCSEPASVRNREGAGGKHYGGIFNANEVEDLPSLFPPQPHPGRIAPNRRTGV
ncbi:MAG: hypothetical protein IPL64_04935 [Flavobacteriales bacterium]|nr:hypothetical protein [Flavobacteriales bacterium]